jgi:OHCU decarboxylase
MTVVPSELGRDEFLHHFGGVYEHSPWIAEQLFGEGLTSVMDGPRSLSEALAEIVSRAGREPQLALLRAHPDLAGKLAISGELTESSSAEQAGAGLDCCTPEEFQELQGIHQSKDRIEIRAAATVADALKALAPLSGDLETLLRRFGSTQVRAQATVGGNIANGSPIGDLAPALIALDARLTLISPNGKRTIALEDFFIDYGKQDRNDDEIILGVSIPLPIPPDFHCWKISKRFDQDISAVSGAFCLKVEDDTITSARIAFGGMAATPRRAVRCEQALVGANIHSDALAPAQLALEADFSAISDMRASAAYRHDVAAGLLEKCLRAIRSRDVTDLYLHAAAEASH